MHPRENCIAIFKIIETYQFVFLRYGRKKGFGRIIGGYSGGNYKTSPSLRSNKLANSF